jgi:hypothetical protein
MSTLMAETIPAPSAGPGCAVAPAGAGGPPAPPPTQKGPGGGGGPADAAEDELGRTTADIDDQVGRRYRPVAGQFGGGAGVGELGLLIAAEDFGPGPEHVGDPAGELPGICRVTGRAGRHHPDLLGAQPPHDRRVVAQRGQRPVQRLGGEPAGGVHALAEPDDLHPPVDIGERPPARIDVGH